MTSAGCSRPAPPIGVAAYTQRCGGSRASVCEKDLSHNMEHALNSTWLGRATCELERCACECVLRSSIAGSQPPDALGLVLHQRSFTALPWYSHTENLGETSRGCSAAPGQVVPSRARGTRPTVARPVSGADCMDPTANAFSSARLTHRGLTMRRRPSRAGALSRSTSFLATVAICCTCRRWRCAPRRLLLHTCSAFMVRVAGPTIT